jgi:F-type H+-transporting ATPase subunit a
VIHALGHALSIRCARCGSKRIVEKVAVTETHSPFDQFKVDRLLPIHLGGVDASVTNAGLFMLVAVLAIIAFLLLAMRRRSLVPTRLQCLAEISHEFIAEMIGQNVGVAGLKFFAFIYALFMFILFCNLIGMIPYSYTVTSQIIVTFALALVVFIGVTAVGFARHGFGFLRLFAPHGVPGAFLPLVVSLDALSYLTRPVSLSLRLAANMMAGHVMLKVFSGFVVALGLFGGWAPLAVVVALTALEFAIAGLQAYVFAMLTCIYLNDAINMHHRT